MGLDIAVKQSFTTNATDNCFSPSMVYSNINGGTPIISPESQAFDKVWEDYKSFETTVSLNTLLWKVIHGGRYIIVRH